VHQRQLSVPSLRGRLMSTSESWTVRSTWMMQGMELNGEEEPALLTPYLRDPQPEGERE